MKSFSVCQVQIGYAWTLLEEVLPNPSPWGEGQIFVHNTSFAIL